MGNRELSSEQAHALRRREAEFENFLMERMPVLADFAEALELPAPTRIVADPQAYLPAISAFLRDQVITDADWAWIHARLGYLVGEILVQRLGGGWMVCTDSDSPQFSRYVVGEFRSTAGRVVTVDTFESTAALLRQPPGRDLEGLVSQLEQAILHGFPPAQPV